MVFTTSNRFHTRKYADLCWYTFTYSSKVAKLSPTIVSPRPKRIIVFNTKTSHSSIPNPFPSYWSLLKLRGIIYNLSPPTVNISPTIKIIIIVYTAYTKIIITYYFFPSRCSYLYWSCACGNSRPITKFSTSIHPPRPKSVIRTNC